MKRIGLLYIGGAFVAALLACTFFLAGCGHDLTNPVAPEINGGADNNHGLRALQSVLDNYGDPFAKDTASLKTGALAKSFKLKLDGDSATIGANGGTLELQMRGFKSKLSIPKKALSTDVTITVEGFLVSTPDWDVLLYDFGPDGLVFNLPAALEVDAGQLKDGTILHLYWLNPASDVWELQEEVVVKGHKIKFDIHHFSKYGIS